MSDCDHRSAVDTGHGDGTGESDPQLAFLEELVDEHARIAGDVVEIGAHVWAIHGSIAVDGDVIMAEYDTEEHARIVLDELFTGHGGADRQ
jgi:hypothetical protein